MDMDMELMTMKFCRFSKIRESLLEYLLKVRQAQRETDELTVEELDLVAAAGDIYAKNDLPKM